MDPESVARSSFTRSPTSGPVLRRDTQEMLHRITRQITTTQDLPQVLQSIVTALVEHSGMLMVRIFLDLDAEHCDVCRRLEGEGAGHASRERGLHLSADAGRLSEVEDKLHFLTLDYQVAPVQAFVSRRAIRTNDVLNLPGYEPEGRKLLQGLGAVGAAAYPLAYGGEALGSIGMVSPRPIEDDEFELLGIFADQAALAIKSAHLFRELQGYRDRLVVENAYLQQQIELEQGFEGIVGESPALRAVLRKVKQVAGVETTVLLTGETGTGKELIARAIHTGSARRDRPLIKMNCGAMPQGVVESELFGHEKGAFTGALDRRIGRFELADQGTLFMDEVGELPLDTQVKLLRVLQEQEFERVGSTQSRKVNVRLVAATNRELEREVAEQRFRSDLFYRLNVFPIRIPPLRDRAQDVPLLVQHFLAHFQRKLAKPLKEVTPDSMTRLTRYHWPGNIRELQNVLERACVLATSPVVELVDELRPVPGGAAPSSAGPVEGQSVPILPLEDSERNHIRRALAVTKGKVHGRDGAAALLGVNPSTLRSRMQKLGIAKSGA